MKRLISILLLFSAFGLTARAQRSYYGDLSVFEKSVRTALQRFYALSAECAGDSENRAMLVYGIEGNYLVPSGVYVPDFMAYRGADAVVTYENYIHMLVQAYGNRLQQGELFTTRLDDLKILGAEWTEDGKGVVLDVTYRNDCYLGADKVYSGKCQVVACFPDQRDLLSCRFRQITPLGWLPSGNLTVPTPVAKDWFTEAMEAYRKFDYVSSFKLFKEHADQQDPEAWGYLGLHYLKGKGTPRDSVRAEACFRRTMESDSPLNLYFQSLNWLLGRGGCVKDPARALRLAERSADKDCAQGWDLLGMMFCDPEVTEVDYLKAFACYSKSAELGNPGGYQGLSVLYTNGWGVAEDPVKAFDYGLRANERGAMNFGFLAVSYMNGYGCQVDVEKGLRYAESGDRYGDPAATTLLGIWYEEHADTNPDNYEKAVRCYVRADEQGNELGGMYLALHYARNDLYRRRDFIRKRLEVGVEEGWDSNGEARFFLSEIELLWRGNQKRALQLCRESAELGFPKAKGYLGEYYLNGWGLPQADWTEAYRLFTQAIDKGVTYYAYYGAAECLFNGYGVSKDEVRGRELLEKGASLGCRACLFSLGQLHLYGLHGYPKDVVKADEYYRKGSSLGDRFGLMCRSGVGLATLYLKPQEQQSPLIWSSALFIWEQSLERGEGLAAYYIGFAYEKGLYGKQVDREKAIHYYRLGKQFGCSVAGKALDELLAKQK